ncbi:MAG: fliK [Caulobacter sp.]|nr:fliK [Caulobacter sp.]
MASRLLSLLTCCALLAPGATPVLAQVGSAAPVQSATLPPPDIFTSGLADTGLPAELWKGTSPALARQVLTLIAAKPLQPGAQSLAYRLLATGAPAPDGAGDDLDLGGARAEALLALGDAAGVTRLLDRAPNIQSSPRMSHAAAEAALFSGDDDKACRVGDALTQGREDVYWLRLRSYCQLRANDVDGAHLTFNLAQTTVRDAVYGRLMGARLAGGAGVPGKASSRNGLEYALSRSLGLETPPPPALAAVTAAPTRFDPALRLTPEMLDAARDGAPEARKAAQGSVILLAALGAPLDDIRRAEAANYTLETRAAPGRLIALNLAAARGLKAETILLVLAICAEAGPKGPPPADRVQLVAALFKVGLADDAWRIALDGLPPL